jgi:hypothetical protein
LRTEQEQEAHFIKLLADRHNVSEEVLREHVKWWETKVIWKRPITSDDAKAWRVIERRILKQSTDDE